jgi:CRISPR-associated protein Csm2
MTDFKKEWIKNGLNAEAVSQARTTGENLATEKVTTSQIRNFFGEIKKIEAMGIKDSKGRGRLYMVAPKLAYTIGRLKSKNKKAEATALNDLLKDITSSIEVIDQDNTGASFKHLVNYMEAIVAYHKYNGGN